ncbi:ATP-dependent nuclease [Anabaena subtropica]|uniref:AAA family ATPase n=1 Tax=Anabaena subtropica FACHB-260 TaxID=2692884 RepID=A0ABR8CKZ5_9NOST|nr:AAA family ATPase [Anabaena subtropica]MBD2343892.1 AAA family ATPase [Anabaena subtropica FACHB-260]
MELQVNISLPYLWNGQSFQKNEWGYLNFLVGQNGTGKTLFAEQLNQQCQTQGLNTRYLSAERLSGLEKGLYNLFGYSQLEKGLDISLFTNYKNNGLVYGLSADAFITLKEKLEVRIRIEATISQLFGRRFRLSEQGGYLKPFLRKTQGEEYALRENECHGLKELITLLTFLYDNQYNCLIIDEPELHLHPQFQSLFLQEIRSIAGDPRKDTSKKCFFLITHSPYFVDIKTIHDLKNCIVFQPDKCPTYIDHLDSDDEYKITRLLPRLNTHHKQFLFASSPIFVEGYLDQQIFALIQEQRGRIMGASGSCFIDVGGKDELALFFRLCKKLNIDARFIADLDALFEGSLKPLVTKDSRCGSYAQNEGLASDLDKYIGQFEQKITELLQIVTLKCKEGSLVDDKLDIFSKKINDQQKDNKKRYIFLVGLKYIGDEIDTLLTQKQDDINFIKSSLQKLITAFKKAGVYLITKGELENCLPSYTGNPYVISDKDKTAAFDSEKNYILSNDLTEEMFHLRYPELINILDEASESNEINMDLYISYAIGDWIHKFQSAFTRGDILDKDSLVKISILELEDYSRIFDIVDFNKNTDGFICKLRLKKIIDLKEREIKFNNKTVAANFQLSEI